MSAALPLSIASTWLLFAGGGAVCGVVGVRRRVAVTGLFVTAGTALLTAFAVGLPILRATQGPIGPDGNEGWCLYSLALFAFSDALLLAIGYVVAATAAHVTDRRAPSAAGPSKVSASGEPPVPTGGPLAALGLCAGTSLLGTAALVSALFISFKISGDAPDLDAALGVMILSLMVVGAFGLLLVPALGFASGLLSVRRAVGWVALAAGLAGGVAGIVLAIVLWQRPGDGVRVLRVPTSADDLPQMLSDVGILLVYVAIPYVPGFLVGRRRASRRPSDGNAHA